MAVYDNVFLVSPDDIKGNTNINYNVDDKVIGQSIRTAQQTYLREIIGTTLLDSLKEKVYYEQEDNVALVDPYKTLVDIYVYDYLCAKVQSEICLSISFKIRNVGVSSDSDVNITTMQIEGVKEMRNYYETYACDAANRLSDFLSDNKCSFPEFPSCVCGGVDNEVGGHFANTNLYLG